MTVDPADPPLRAVLEATAPDGDGGPVFDASWQARAFAMAVALYEGGGDRPWEEFQAQLVEAIEAAPGEVAADAVDEDYYRRWLEALEGLLLEDGVVTAEELDERAREFAAGERTAAEFVEGDPEAH